MLLQVTHLTRYHYKTPVETAQHMVYLQPLQTPGQQVQAYSLQITPSPTEQGSTQDVYGNTRTFFTIQSAHDRLEVVAHSVVATHPAPSACPADLPWEQVREHFRYHAGAAFDAAAEFGFASAHIPRHRDFAQYTLPSFAPGTPLLDCAAHLMQRIYTEFRYQSLSTQVNTPTLDALHQRQGVCQDFAHIFIACWRAMGLPARYVSGYLLTQPAPGQPRLIGSDASHAWVSVYLPALNSSGTLVPGSWHDFDPTNNRSPGEDYVVLSTGRDYADVSPMRGVIHGGARHDLEVEVTVLPLD